ncbi:Ubiquitin-conjugating enzyme E2 J2 [Entophlyctis luteolus]|nr:Ubiquitin-conjugating enzyme E2 J2 [Entophlyctis luteolus]
MASKGAPVPVPDPHHPAALPEFNQLQRDPVPFIVAKPLDSNILEWHYLITGPDDSPYKGGMYWGKLIFPIEYPFSPPSIQMITPSGRFKPSVRLCFSMSDYHPETWCAAWNVGTILKGLLSFMVRLNVVCEKRTGLTSKTAGRDANKRKHPDDAIREAGAGSRKSGMEQGTFAVH